MRICSFLPSATEIVCALGLADQLAGVTYECNFPPEVRGRTVVVHTRLAHAAAAAAAGEIDRQVTDFAARGESLYRVDDEALRRIQPDLIITQDLCHVCAASPDDLPAVLAALPHPPRVLTLSPHRLADVWEDIRSVGRAAGRASEAETLAAALEARVERVRAAVAGAARPRVLCLEWLDPPFLPGHWLPEMIELAGGECALGRAGEPSRRAAWPEVLAAAPDVVLLAPCGYNAEQAAAEFHRTKLPAGWEQLAAVRAGRVWALDADSYFSRPGPRLADGVEILAALLHPERAPAAAADRAARPVRAG